MLRGACNVCLRLYYCVSKWDRTSENAKMRKKKKKKEIEENRDRKRRERKRPTGEKIIEIELNDCC